MDNTAFWMVWSPQGTAPTHPHESLGSATAEAERLARKHPGRQFYVLQALEGFCVNDIQRVRLTEYAVPF